MIPRAHITAWRAKAPWSTDAQVEQDLVLTRALVEIYSDPSLAQGLAFRGGTALHKLYLDPPARYSEDLDLVQAEPGQIGPLLDALHRRLDPWLGKPQWKQGQGTATLVYRFESEIAPVTPLRLKVEINTREHLTVLGYRSFRVRVENPWFAGASDVKTFAPEELLATKLRALYQRKKGRDLFDLAVAMTELSQLDVPKLVECFEAYLAHSGTRISRAEFEANLAEKITDPAFTRDVTPLLSTAGGRAPGFFKAETALEEVKGKLIALLPGELWKSAEGDRQVKRR
ncbi:MAG: nucleotidyl transferase AbiEii/AbiGii toxin family protein [Deltaproteobacteria bacterium]|nr:nucleotidyl transferase AbiEii/AbiGii toxin family protein [Deltaproteobacteria bacterium]